MKPLFECIIEVPKHGIKKNSKQIFRNNLTGRRFIASNSKAQYLEKYLNSKLLTEKLKKRIDTITCDVNAQYTFIFPYSVYFTKKEKRSNKIGDLSNLFEMVSDSLQKVGILENDSLICGFDGSRRLPTMENKFYLRIVLTELKDALHNRPE